MALVDRLIEGPKKESKTNEEMVRVAMKDGTYDYVKKELVNDLIKKGEVVAIVDDNTPMESVLPRPLVEKLEF